MNQDFEDILGVCLPIFFIVWAIFFGSMLWHMLGYMNMEQYFFKDQIVEAKEKLKHIKSPMNFYQILEEFGKDSYNSELLLQHALLCLLHQNFKVE